MIQGMSDFLNL